MLAEITEKKIVDQTEKPVRGKVKPADYRVNFQRAPKDGFRTAGVVTIPASGPVSLVIDADGHASLIQD